MTQREALRRAVIYQVLTAVKEVIEKAGYETGLSAGPTPTLSIYHMKLKDKLRTEAKKRGAASLLPEVKAALKALKPYRKVYAWMLKQIRTTYDAPNASTLAYTLYAYSGQSIKDETAINNKVDSRQARLYKVVDGIPAQVVLTLAQATPGLEETNAIVGRLLTEIIKAVKSAL